MNKYSILTIDGHQEFKNILPKILNNKFDRINDSNSFYNTIVNYAVPREQSLVDYRTLWMLGPRQTGTTCSIAATFNINTDVYVGFKLNHAKDFKKRFIQIQGIDFPMMYTSLKADNRFVPISPHKLSNIKRVFIDIGGVFILDKPEILKQIKLKIAYFEKILNDDVVYIIT